MDARSKDVHACCFECLGDRRELLRELSVDQQCSNEAAEKLCDDVVRNLAPREAFEDGERKSNTWRQVSSRCGTNKSDGESDSQAVTYCDSQNGTKALLLVDGAVVSRGQTL